MSKREVDQLKQFDVIMSYQVPVKIRVSAANADDALMIGQKKLLDGDGIEIWESGFWIFDEEDITVIEVEEIE